MGDMKMSGRSIKQQGNSKSNFQGLIQKEVEFPKVSAKHFVEFSGLLVLHLRISKITHAEFSVVKLCFVFVCNLEG